jgi:hypothetical protein
VGLSKLARSAELYVTRLLWTAFPLKPHSKVPLISTWQGGNGHLDATLDVDQIRRWWHYCPNANPGIACDERSGLLVLDVDPRNGGDEELGALERRYGELPHTVVGLTGGGGQHYVFKRPPGVRFRGKFANSNGIDIKASGYICAPPSVHPDGGIYRWDAAAHPLETELAELPSWAMQQVLSFEPDGDYGKPADDCAKSFLARAFSHAGWLGSRIDACRINCWCPWEDEHSQRSGSGGTVIFAPKSGGSGAGWFHCAHTSHGKKTMRDVMAVLPPEACRLAAADAAEDAADAAAPGGDYETAERLAIVEADK